MAPTGALRLAVHPRRALEQLGHDTLARRVEVLDDHEGEPARVGDGGQELLDGLQPPAEAPIATMVGVRATRGRVGAAAGWRVRGVGEGFLFRARRIVLERHVGTI
jgi:hypothetical protein